jgi:creatinine amidohydrolase
VLTPIRRLRRWCVALALLAPVPVVAQSAVANILQWNDLTAAELARLDRTRTVVIVPAGLVEAHGPVLPNGAELSLNERMAADIASAIAGRPGWTVLMAPTIPLGSGAFDRRAGRSGFGGTLSVRATTLQAVFTDLGDNLGQQGFRYVFVINGHADANHDRALDAAGDVFAAMHRGMMVHLLGRRSCHADDLEAPPITLFSATAMTADADSPHGGALETSRYWWLRPDRVDSVVVRRIADVPAQGADSWAVVARQRDWPGFVGAPRFASLELGEWLYDTQRRHCTELAHRFLDGLDPRTVPRRGDLMRAYPDVRLRLDAQARAEADEGARHQRVLSGGPPRP